MILDHCGRTTPDGLVFASSLGISNLLLGFLACNSCCIAVFFFKKNKIKFQWACKSCFMARWLYFLTQENVLILDVLVHLGKRLCINFPVSFSFPPEWEADFVSAPCHYNLLVYKAARMSEKKNIRKKNYGVDS